MKKTSLPIPFGWYAVAFSDELSIKEVKPLYFFAKDLVLYRTESGIPVLLDAFCPHLGAHLGHGGEVHGESIACPFHGWEFEHVETTDHLSQIRRQVTCIHELSQFFQFVCEAYLASSLGSQD